MQMGETESEDLYVKRVHQNDETLILSCGKGALFCSKILVAEEKANTTEKEVKDKIDNLVTKHIIE